MRGVERLQAGTSVSNVASSVAMPAAKMAATAGQSASVMDRMTTRCPCSLDTTRLAFVLEP